MKVDAKLYDFLKENETGLYKNSDGEVIAFVHVYFFRLEDFAEIVGNYWFEEGGLAVQMFRDTICVDINRIIESDGSTLIDYKNCFEPSDWKYYEEDIKKQCED